MFDPMYDQAAGLRSVARPAGIRLVPVVLSRDTDTAFDLVWLVGSGLSALGRNVVALDATCREQHDRQGLTQMLQARDVAEPADAGQTAWRIVPSQSGLNTLMHTAQTLGAQAAQARLAAVFPPETLLVVLAPKEWLSVLFEESAARPLVPFVLEPSGVVDAYSAIKVLYQAGGMQPVLVPVNRGDPERLSTQSLDVLSETARKHLGWSPDSWPLPAAQSSNMRDDWSHWMLRMEASALALDDGGTPSPSWYNPTHPEALVPQLWSR